MNENLILRIENFIKKSPLPIQSPSNPRVNQQQFPYQRRRNVFHPRRNPNEPINEVATQLTPKGRYRTVGDIAEDFRESQRLGRKLTGLNPTTPNISTPQKRKYQRRTTVPNQATSNHSPRSGRRSVGANTPTSSPIGP